MAKRPDRKCLWCGKNFAVYKNRKNHQFDSAECWEKHQASIRPPKKRTCQSCGEIFHISPAVAGGATRQYCNESCRKGLKARRAVEYRDKVKKEIQRKPCVVCGVPVPLHHEKYCSKRCWRVIVNAQKKKTKPLQNCRQCGGSFYGWDRQKFCTERCRYIFRRLEKLGQERVCPVCKKQFPWGVGGNGNQHIYCSTRCCRKAGDIRQNSDVVNISDRYVGQLLNIKHAPEELKQARRVLLRLKRVIANGDDKTPLRANRTGE